MPIADREHVEIAQASELAAWLHDHHDTSPGAWVVTYKKASGKPAPTYDEIVRELLAWGWVDSRPGTVDELRSKLYVCQRKRGSGWSAANKKRVEELLAAGLMREPGLAAVEAAQADGSWSKIDSAQSLDIPEDLAAEFAKHPGSARNFANFPPGVRRQILEWISQAKTAATRATRASETARLASENIRANQWRKPKAVD